MAVVFVTNANVVSDTLTDVLIVGRNELTYLRWYYWYDRNDEPYSIIQWRRQAYLGIIPHSVFCWQLLFSIRDYSAYYSIELVLLTGGDLLANCCIPSDDIVLLLFLLVVIV